MNIQELNEKLAKFVEDQYQSEFNSSTTEQVGTRVIINPVKPMKGIIIKDKYTHPETGKACRDVKLDDGRIVQVYNGQFTID